ncbi:MAG: HAD-IC family P-type ATPase, partial [Clostridia bacterium]|nr:HAD-IC family P-type ATPase [Clostridia bacterium]
SKQNYEYYKEKIKDNSIISNKKELTQLYIECLACCQGVTRVKDKIIGDPIDVEMFESTGWELIEEPEDTNNYDPRIATYVRPKEEKSLTEKLNGLGGFMQNPNNIQIQELMKDHYELGIVRRFDFSSKLQRMSTLVKNLNQPNFVCYCKGSPEKIQELCQPKTIPSDFNEQLNNYTSRGYRVLAMGSKIIQMDLNKALEVNRTFCEKDLVFLGLLIVQNKLKLATNDTLMQLSHNGHLRVRMATGDNIMTAVCVGRKSNLIEPNAIVYSCEIETENSQNEIGTNKDEGSHLISTGVYESSLIIEKERERKKRKLVWKTIESFNEEDESNSEGGSSSLKQGIELIKRSSFGKRLSCLLPHEVGEKDTQIEEEANAMVKVVKEDKILENAEEDDDDIVVDLSRLPFDEEKEDIEIAVTGKTFEILYRLNLKYEKLKKKAYTVQKNDKMININNNTRNDSLVDFAYDDLSKLEHFKVFHDAFRLVLKNCSIYARCSPDNKTQIVQSLQKESFTVLMCGDGANDCGALKVADVGISLSTEEASIAAPFTSKTPDISCCIEVLKEGKCALVTSLQTFKYILLYSLTQFISVTLLILVDSYLSDWEFMASDLFLISPLAFLIPLAPAYPKLTHHKPVSSLFSFSIICSMGLQTICVAAFQIAGQFLTNAYFPSDIFEELRTCWGEFDHIQERKPNENNDDEEDTSGEKEENNNGESEGGEGG